MKRLFLYSDGLNSGFYPNARELQRGKVKGQLRPGKRYIDDETIPAGWEKCEDDRSAIQQKRTMRDFIRSLT